MMYDMATTPPHNLQARIKPELKAALKEEAKANRRTETATLEIILEEALKHRLPLPSTSQRSPTGTDSGENE